MLIMCLWAHTRKIVKVWVKYETSKNNQIYKIMHLPRAYTRTPVNMNISDTQSIYSSIS